MATHTGTIDRTEKNQKVSCLLSTVFTPWDSDPDSQMRYIAAYLLLKIGGNESPTAADVTKVIQSVGIEVDKARLDSLISELDGKDINAVRFFNPLPSQQGQRTIL